MSVKSFLKTVINEGSGEPKFPKITANDIKEIYKKTIEMYFDKIDDNDGFDVIESVVGKKCANVDKYYGIDDVAPAIDSALWDSIRDFVNGNAQKIADSCQENL